MATINSHLESKAGGAIVIAGIIGLVLSDLLPTPADLLVFKIDRQLRDKWKNGEISAKKYWEKKMASYYLLNSAWWGGIGLIALTMQSDPKKQLNLLIGLIGAGAVLALILKYIKQDTKELALEDAEIEDLMKKNPELASIMNKPEFKNVKLTVKEPTGNGSK